MNAKSALQLLMLMHVVKAKRSYCGFGVHWMAMTRTWQNKMSKIRPFCLNFTGSTGYEQEQCGTDGKRNYPEHKEK